MIVKGKDAEHEIDNIKKIRYACYLAVHNSDSSKTIVAQAQTYFAMQTRRAEKEFDELTEDESKRLVLRMEI